MKQLNATKAVSVAAACVLVGAGAGIAGSAAAPSKHRLKPHTSRRGGPHPGGLRPGGPGPRAVHGEEVVLNRAGSAFIKETEDNGVVQSVSGDQLTIKEGTPTVSYQTLTLTIPAGAKVYRNFASASLSDLKANDHVHVSRSSDGTTVFAVDGRMRPPRERPPHDRGGRGPGPDGPPPPGM